MADSIIGKISVGDGATFTPAVSSDGKLSWTNNKNLPNPETVDLAQAVIDSGAGLFLPVTGGTVTGSVEVTGGVTGNLTGNVIGNLTGNVTGDVTGNADTATNATNDGDGNKIDTTYMPFSGGTFAGDVNGVTPPAGDNSKKLANTEFIQALANILVPIGCVQAFAGNTLPAGWLACDGSAVSRTTYAALFAVIGTTYGAGNGRSTFNLPNLTDRFIEGSTTAGSVKAAGIPNITGSLEGATTLNVAIDGALGWEQTDATNYSMTYQSGSMRYGAITFNASNSDSIYGNSATVQPPAVTMRYIIKY